ncbi:hypothetical protein IMCC1989_1698 [gamma proteobacterium IMCC1989]|nr:hypothetical protein IMCC1989_1698 [gamma proteobacterium IMCC1989]
MNKKHTDQKRYSTSSAISDTINDIINGAINGTVGYFTRRFLLN